MRTPHSTGITLAGVAAASLLLAGCASPATTASDGSDALVQVVASTNVYGSIAEQIGGDLVSVTSIIDGAAQDPHSYEASARDQLELSKADLVIENGGGYDPFIDTLLGGAGNDDVAVVTASEASGLLDDDHAEDDHAEDDHADDDHAEDEHADDESHESHDHIEGFNEHVWYSFDAIDRIAEEIAHELGDIDEANSAAYDDNYAAFSAELAGLRERADEIAVTTAGRGAAITEPVPTYLLEALGFENKTPDAFSEAIEEGTDVAPAVLNETLALFTDGSVALLAYNGQTTGPETEQVLQAAEDAGIAVVSLTETMPEGDDYVSWMTANLEAIADTLD